VRGKAGKLALRPHIGSQPDALGLATRLAVARLGDADIVVEPLLRRAGLSVTQISSKDMRIGVASQIMFLELAAQALHDPLFGFRLARDAEVRQLGLLYYVAALSETLGEALLEVGKHVGQDDGAGGVVLRHKIGQKQRRARPGGSCSSR
jgi:Arabinose-binding domain of AraC transcription regulator, N-term